MDNHVFDLIALLVGIGCPTGLIALFMRQRHVHKMKLLEAQANASRVAALEEARADLEARVRTLETIVTADDARQIGGIAEPARAISGR